MTIFPEAVAALLGGRTVRCSFLILFDFDSGPWRVWTGAGRIETAGETWLGVGSLVSISALEQATNGEAPAANFSLSGVPGELLTLVRDEFDAEALDRIVTVYLQLHNKYDDCALELYDQPFAIWGGRMQTPRFELTGLARRVVGVAIESLFSLRSRPAFSQYTDSDQQARFPGDRGFEFVPTLVNKVVTWPDF